MCAQIILSALCFASFIVLSPAGNGAPLTSAKVTQIIKEVTLLPTGGASRPAAVSDEVTEKSAVRTGNESRAELTFADLTITRLGANTVFSFNNGKREIDLASGAVLVQVPKNGETATVRTAAATAAVSGGTAMVEFHDGYPLKVYVLEGATEVCTVAGDCTTVAEGQTLTSSDGKLAKPVSFNVQKLYQTSLLLNDFAPLPNDDLIQQAIQQQQTDQTSNPPPATSSNNNNPSSQVIDDTNTAASANPSGTNGGSSPPPQFGPPPTISNPNPYVIGPGTQISTDPTITTNGVSAAGTIYRSLAQDGPPSQFLFGETATAFDNLVFGGGGGEHPLAVFKFSSLQLTGNPTVTIGSGAPDRIVLASIGDITSGAPGGTLTFAPATRLSLITGNGSITLGSEVSFSGLDHIEMYARGSKSTLSLASPISNVNVVKLSSGGDINVSGTINATMDFGALAQGSFDSGNTHITANNIEIHSLTGNISVNGTSVTGSSLTLTADAGMVNLTSSIGLGAFPTYDTLTITGQTVNLPGTSIVINPLGTANITAGTGGINGIGLDLEGGSGSDLELNSLGDIHLLNAFTSGFSHTGSITAGGAFVADGEVATGTLQARTSITVGSVSAGAITAGTDITANGGSITTDGNITAGGNISLQQSPPGVFGNITAGKDITAAGIFTPGDPCVVMAGGNITAGSVITGTLQAGDSIHLGNAAGGFVFVNHLTATNLVSFTDVGSFGNDNSVASGGLGFTPVDFSLSASQIQSTGPNYPALVLDGEGAASSSAPNPGNGGNANIHITGAGLAIGDTQDLQSISANGGAFDNGSVAAGGNGGNIQIQANGNVAVDSIPSGSTISATTGVVPDVFANYSGAGGTVTINSPGTIGVSGSILVSSDDQRNFFAPPFAVGGGTPGRESASGGSITLQSSATTGTGINVSGSLQSLLNGNAPGPGGTITLSTMGSNIVVTGTVEADGGTITIDQNDPPGGTPSIAINGATLTADTLNITGAGDVNIGTNVSNNLFVSNVSVTAPGSITLDASGFSLNQFSASSTVGGDVHIESASVFSASGPVVLNSALASGRSIATGGNVTLITAGDFVNNSTKDFSRVEVDNLGAITTGGNATVNVLGNFTTAGTSTYSGVPGAGDFEILVQNTNGQIGTGGNLTFNVGQTVQLNGLALYVQNYDETATPAGSIQNGGNITVGINGDLNASSYVDLFLNNRGGGKIHSPVTVNFIVDGAMNTGSDFTEFAISNRYDSGQGNQATSLIDGNATLYMHAGSVTMPAGIVGFAISNRGGSEINGNATATFDVTHNATIGDVSAAFPGTGTWIIYNDVAHDSESVNAPAGGTINGSATLTLNIGGAFNLANDNAIAIYNFRNNGTPATMGGFINGTATVNLNADSITEGGELDVEILNYLVGTNPGQGGQIFGNAEVNVMVTNALTSTGSAGNSSSADLIFDINNHGTNSTTATGGFIRGNAAITIQAGSISSAGALNAFINNTDGTIRGDADINVTVGGTAAVNDAEVQIFGNDPAGAAAINLNGGNYNVTTQFVSTIDGNGTITLNNASIAADVLKIGVFGPNGVLKIGGGTLSAATELKLYAPGSNGTIEFTANVTLGGNVAAMIAANTVTIDNGKTVTLGANGAFVYANVQNYNTAGFGSFSGSVTSNPLGGQPTFGAPGIAPAIASATSSSTAVTDTAKSSGTMTNKSDTTPRTINLSNSSQLRSVVDSASTSGGRATVRASAFGNNAGSSSSTQTSTRTNANNGTSRIRAMSGVTTIESPTGASSSPAPVNNSTSAANRFSRF